MAALDNNVVHMGSVLQKTFDDVGDAGGHLGSDIEGVPPVMIWCMAGVPSVKSVRCPGAVLGGLLVEDNAGAK